MCEIWTQKKVPKMYLEQSKASAQTVTKSTSCFTEENAKTQQVQKAVDKNRDKKQK